MKCGSVGDVTIIGGQAVTRWGYVESDTTQGSYNFGSGMNGHTGLNSDLSALPAGCVATIQINGNNKPDYVENTLCQYIEIRPSATWLNELTKAGNLLPLQAR